MPDGASRQTASAGRGPFGNGSRDPDVPAVTHSAGRLPGDPLRSIIRCIIILMIVTPEGNGGSVLVEQRDRILIMTINRPHAKNAIDAAVSHGLAAAMDQLDDDPALSVGIVTGAGGSFCAGMDLKAFARGESVAVEGRGLGFTERPPKKPLIAAVEGYALAGGTEVALATDLIVAADDAAFGIPEVKRGLVAGGGV
jgi:enoyl-CoA hydratase